MRPAAVSVARGRAIFDLMRTQVVGGQFLDVLQQAHGAADPQRMRTITRYKSAKYTVEHPLRLGGALADAPPALLAAYSRFGLPLGEAFQLRDDVLGVFGDPVRTGKPDTDDLRDGKRTQLVAIAEQRATRSQQRVLAQHVGNPHLDDAGAAEVRLVLLDTGAVTDGRANHHPPDLAGVRGTRRRAAGPHGPPGARGADRRGHHPGGLSAHRQGTD
jgi:geranylgeranyl diphosphate synthase type I